MKFMFNIQISVPSANAHANNDNNSSPTYHCTENGMRFCYLDARVLSVESMMLENRFETCVNGKGELSKKLSTYKLEKSIANTKCTFGKHTNISFHPRQRIMKKTKRKKYKNLFNHSYSTR